MHFVISSHYRIKYIDKGDYVENICLLYKMDVFIIIIGYYYWLVSLYNGTSTFQCY